MINTTFRGYARGERPRLRPENVLAKTYSKTTVGRRSLRDLVPSHYARNAQ